MCDDDSVVLYSIDSKPFKVLRKVAALSKTLKDLMEDAGAEKGIPLPTVSAKILEKVVTYCVHHVDDVVPVKAAADAPVTVSPTTIAEPYVMNSWDKDFTSDMDQETVFEMILAANYLDIRSLLELCCRVVANSVLGKTPKEIYAMFKVEQELTPEEEEAVRKENPWIEDQ